MEIGNTKINFIQNNLSDEERRKNLKDLYDYINKLADKYEKKGINVDSWFYTEEEIKILKSNEKYKFI